MASRHAIHRALASHLEVTTQMAFLALWNRLTPEQQHQWKLLADHDRTFNEEALNSLLPDHPVPAGRDSGDFAVMALATGVQAIWERRRVSLSDWACN